MYLNFDIDICFCWYERHNQALLKKGRIGRIFYDVVQNYNARFKNDCKTTSRDFIPHKSIASKLFLKLSLSLSSVLTVRPHSDFN